MNKFRISDCQAHIPNCALLPVVSSDSCKMKTMTTAATGFKCFSFSSGININVLFFPSWTFILKYYIKSSDKEYKNLLSVRKSILQVFHMEFTGFVWFEYAKSVMGGRSAFWAPGWRKKDGLL